MRRWAAGVGGGIVVADVSQALLERGDFVEPLPASGFGEPFFGVGLDGVQAWFLGRVEPQEWATGRVMPGAPR